MYAIGPSAGNSGFLFALRWHQPHNVWGGVYCDRRTGVRHQV